jgi:hypothetical protein
MLIYLPEVLSTDILSNWCSLKTVGEVDSAFCNKTDRENFLCLQVDPTFSSTDRTYSSSDAFWGWVLCKGIKLQYLDGTQRKVFSYGLVTTLDCSKVLEVWVNGLGQHLKLEAMLINKSIHLKILRVVEQDVLRKIDTYKQFLQLISLHIWSGLTNLTIHGRESYKFFNPLDLSNIAVACTKLRSFTVRKSDNGTPQNTFIQILHNNKQLEQLTLKGCCVYNTALMMALGTSCVALRSLLISDLQTANCSVGSVCAMISSCKQLSFCSLSNGFLFSQPNGQLTLQVKMLEFMPIFSTVFSVHYNKLMVIKLCGRIEESLLLEIGLKCPQLTELCIFESWRSWSVNTLGSIIAHCVKLEVLTMSFVNATMSEMMNIFCFSGQTLVLQPLDVWTTEPSIPLAGYIKKNSSIKKCRTDPHLEFLYQNYNGWF